MSRLTMETGHRVSGDVVKVEGKAIRFVAEDGRTMFEVIAQRDGKSVQVRISDNCVVDDVLYDTTMTINPVCANTIEVSAKPYIQ